MRVELGLNVDSRDGTLLRDEKLVNFQLNPDGVQKRAGTSRSSYSATANSGIGIFVYGTKIYMWTGAMTTSPASANL